MKKKRIVSSIALVSVCFVLFASVPGYAHEKTPDGSFKTIDDIESVVEGSTEEVGAISVESIEVSACAALDFAATSTVKKRADFLNKIYKQYDEVHSEHHGSFYNSSDYLATAGGGRIVGNDDEGSEGEVVIQTGYTLLRQEQPIDFTFQGKTLNLNDPGVNKDEPGTFDVTGKAQNEAEEIMNGFRYKMIAAILSKMIDADNDEMVEFVEKAHLTQALTRAELEELYNSNDCVSLAGVSGNGKRAFAVFGQLFGFTRAGELSKSPQVVDEIINPVEAMFFPASVALSLLGLMWQTVKLIVSHKGEALATVVKGFAIMLCVHVFATTAAIVASKAADAYTAYIGDVLASTVKTEDIIFGMMSAFLATWWAWTLAIILLPFAFIAMLIFQWMLIARQVMLVFMVGLLPFAASGLLLKSTRPWLMRLVGSMVGVYLYKPAAAASFSFIIMMIASSSFTITIMGTAMFILLPFMLPKMMKIFSFAGVSPDGTAGNMMRTFMADAGEYNKKEPASGGPPGGPPGGGPPKRTAKHGSNLGRGLKQGMIGRGVSRAGNIAGRVPGAGVVAAVGRTANRGLNPMAEGNVDAATFAAGTAANGMAEGMGQAADTTRDAQEDYLTREL